MTEDPRLYSIARRVTDEVLGAGAYDSVNHPHKRQMADLGDAMAADEKVHAAHCGPDLCKYGDPECPMRSAVETARLRLITTTSNLAGAIRGCQLEGMTPRQIGEVMGLSPVNVRLLINSWGLNR